LKTVTVALLSKKQLDYTRARYIKYVRLFTTDYAPKDTSKSYPFVMQRTPY